MPPSSNPLLLPLRPSRPKDQDSDPLPFLIAQINEQRGSFRDITEDSLREEIKFAKENGGDGTDFGSGKAKTGEDGKNRQEEVLKGREEILTQVG